MIVYDLIMISSIILVPTWSNHLQSDHSPSSELILSDKKSFYKGDRTPLKFAHKIFTFQFAVLLNCGYRAEWAFIRSATLKSVLMWLFDISNRS